MLQKYKLGWQKMSNGEPGAFLRDVKAQLRGPRLKIMIRVEARLKQSILGLHIPASTFEIGPKLGVLPLLPSSPT